jgi:DnaJ-class molecular chaperone
MICTVCNGKGKTGLLRKICKACGGKGVITPKEPINLMVESDDDDNTPVDLGEIGEAVGEVLETVVERRHDHTPVESHYRHNVEHDTPTHHSQHEPSYQPESSHHSSSHSESSHSYDPGPPDSGGSDIGGGDCGGDGGGGASSD